MRQDSLTLCHSFVLEQSKLFLGDAEVGGGSCSAIIGTRPIVITDYTTLTLRDGAKSLLFAARETYFDFLIGVTKVLQRAQVALFVSRLVALVLHKVLCVIMDFAQISSHVSHELLVCVAFVIGVTAVSIDCRHVGSDHIRFDVGGHSLEIWTII